MVGTDIYSTINAEIVHILGLFGPPAKLQNPANNSTVTRLATRDPQGNGSGFYYVFDGPSATHLLTSYDSGGGGTDTGSATHTAAADAGNQPVAFTSAFRGAVQLRGSIDAGNATGGDTRVLASDNVANLLKDAFGYEVRLPSTIPGFTYNVGMTGRTLRVNGGPDGSGGAAMTTAAPPHAHGSAGTAHDDGHVHHGRGRISWTMAETVPTGFRSVATVTIWSCRSCWDGRDRSRTSMPTMGRPGVRDPSTAVEFR